MNEIYRQFSFGRRFFINRAELPFEILLRACRDLLRNDLFVVLKNEFKAVKIQNQQSQNGLAAVCSKDRRKMCRRAFFRFIYVLVNVDEIEPSG